MQKNTENKTPEFTKNTSIEDARKEANEKKREARKNAEATVRGFMASELFTTLTGDEQAAFTLLFPAKKQRAGGNGNVALWKRISAKFAKKGDSVNLMDIFKEFRTGEAEMRWTAKQMAKNEQKWIQYNTDTMDFTLIHVGEWTDKAPYVYQV